MGFKPYWLEVANSYIGVSEIPGPKTSGVISAWLQRLGAWWSDDETPWCGTFVAAVMQQCGLPLPKYWMRAKAWADWGFRIDSPIDGCIVVFDRQGGGHVGFVTGKDKDGRLVVLGGNQGNSVKLSAFDAARVIAYVWPAGQPIPHGASISVAGSALPLSTNEA